MSATRHFKFIFSLLIPLLCAFTVHSTRQFHQSFLSISESLTSRNSIDNVAATNSASKVTRYISSLNVVKTIPRDGLTFTEGLSFKDANTLLESGGGYGRSVIQYLNAADMKVLKKQGLDNDYFGEGCELLSNGQNGNNVYQMTYRERKVFVWDANTLKLKNTLEMPEEIQEGWGMTKRTEKDESGNKVTRLYVTDGSSNIHVIDPNGFKVLKSIKVMNSENTEVSSLNELEFVNGKLWANIFMDNSVAVIDPETGFVEAMVDMSPLQAKAREQALASGIYWDGNSVLNGIAYHPETNRLLMTGKMWPMVFEIKVEGL